MKLNALIKREAMARGLLVYPMGGTIDVRSEGTMFCTLAPPFIVNREQVDVIVERLERDAVDAAVASVGRG